MPLPKQASTGTPVSYHEEYDRLWVLSMVFNRKLISLSIFLAGIAAAILVFTIPGLANGAATLEQAGYFGVFVSGVLYALSFTAPAATVVFAQLPDSLNPILVGLIGGFGALIYDVTVFALFRHESHHHMIEMIKTKIPGSHRVPQWATTGAGLFILASPLPDELAAGLFGFSTVRVSRFMLLSFICNAIGIMIIAGAL